jgi:hypothetical protein
VAVPGISIGDATLAEGNTGTVNAQFDVTLSAASSQTITVSYATSDGTAIGGADYQASSGTLTFSPGQTVKSIIVPVTGESLVELNETFSVNLSGATNATIADAAGAGTITNDDSATLAINDVTLAEGNTGTTSFTFTATLSAAVDVPVSVSFATANGTATTADSDYVAASGTLNFTGTAGETKTMTVDVNGDPKVELEETFLVNLSGLTAGGRSATLADSQGQGTISNDDSATLAIDDVTLAEGNAGTRSFTFTATLSAAVDSPVSVNFAAANGTATTADADYAAASGTLNFAGTAGETKTMTVNVNGDQKVELNEAFLSAGEYPGIGS